MATMRSMMDDYALESVTFFNEFDKSNFITNAKYALGKGLPFNKLEMDTAPITTSIAKASRHLDSIEIDTFALSEFLPAIVRSGKIDQIKFEIPDLFSKRDVIYNTRYLEEALDNLEKNIQAIADGTMDIKTVKDYCIHKEDYCDALKRRCLVIKDGSKFDYNQNAKSMIRRRALPTMVVTTESLQNEVIPFIKAIPAKKSELVTKLNLLGSELGNVLTRLHHISDDTQKYIISHEDLDQLRGTGMMNLLYNVSRCILEASTLMTFTILEQVHTFEAKITGLQDMYNAYQRAFADAKNVVESGGYSAKVISATDANSLCDALLNKDTSVYTELSSHLEEYHEGFLSRLFPGESHEIIMDHITHGNFDNAIYDDICKMYIEIGNGLDILAKNSDDYLMIFQDLIRKSGFLVPLEQRFEDKIEAIEDLSNYALTDVPSDDKAKSDTYMNLLAEIHFFPDNMKKIADAAADTLTKIKYVYDLFHRDKNGELENSETMNELKIFMEGLTDQFNIVTRRVATRMYDRLKDLAAKADSCVDYADGSVSAEDQIWANDYQMDEDYVKEAFDVLIDMENALNDVYMEELVKEYHIAKELQERNVRIIFEAEGETTGTNPAPANAGNANNTQQNAGENPSVEANTKQQNQQKTQQQTQNQNQNTNKNPNLIKKKLSDTIDTVFDKFMAAITDLMDKLSKQNAVLLRPEVQTYLKNFNWTSGGNNGEPAAVTIPPYHERMPADQVMKDLQQVESRCGSLRDSEFQSIQTYEALRNRIYQNTQIIKHNHFDTLPQAEEKDAITTFYKIRMFGKNADLNKQTRYEGNNANTLVNQIIIPFVQDFYSQYLPQMKTSTQNIKNSMRNTVQSLVTESAREYEIGSYFMEADTPAGTNPPKPQGQSQDPKVETANGGNANINTKAGWYRRIVINYIGSVMNSLRDRNSMYTKVITALLPAELRTNKHLQAARTTVQNATQNVQAQNEQQNQQQ